MKLDTRFYEGNDTTTLVNLKESIENDEKLIAYMKQIYKEKKENCWKKFQGCKAARNDLTN